MNNIKDVNQRQEKQKELTNNLKKSSENVDPFIRNQILEYIQLKIDPNHGWKQLDDYDISYAPNKLDFLKELITKLKKFDKLKD